MPTDRGCETPYILIFQKLLVLKSLCNDTNIYAAITFIKRSTDTAVVSYMICVYTLRLTVVELR